MAFKMKGSPIHRGDIQGTSGHSSALKAKWIWETIKAGAKYGPKIHKSFKSSKLGGKIDDAWVAGRDAVSAAWRTPSVTSNSKNITKKVVVETITNPSKVAKAAAGGAGATYVIESGTDIAKQNVDDSKIEKTTKAAEITKKQSQKINWKKSSKLFDNAIKNDSTILDYISPDATGKTNYDKLANTVKILKKQNKEFSTQQDLLNKYNVK